MTLLEMKNKVLRMIEEVGAAEITDDPDIKAKLNDVINQVMFEVARMKRIPAIKKLEVTADKLEYKLRNLSRFYQLHSVYTEGPGGEYVDFDLFEDIIDFESPCSAKIKYYKYPERIEDDTDDELYTFELSDDALEVMVYGVAADLLKSDISNQYGKIYAERYETMLQRLDSRTNTGMIIFEGGGI